MYNKYYKFIRDLEVCVNDLNEEYSNVIILCIGTKKIIGDSIGPIIGENIKYMENEYLRIYGALENTINFNNAKSILTEIYENFDNPYLITIDAALGNKESMGRVILNKGYIKIGKALEKSICFYSNLTIKCVVGENTNSRFNNLIELKNADVEQVKKMANIVSSGIEKVLTKLAIYNNCSFYNNY